MKILDIFVHHELFRTSKQQKTTIWEFGFMKTAWNIPTVVIGNCRLIYILHQKLNLDPRVVSVSYNDIFNPDCEFDITTLRNKIMYFTINLRKIKLTIYLKNLFIFYWI